MEKKENLILCSAFFALSTFYVHLIKSLNPQNAMYPKFIATIMFVLTIALTLQVVLSKNIETKEKTIKKFETFQFFTVLVLGFIYISIINFIGYFTSTLIFLSGLLLLLKASKKLSFVISLGFCIFVYFVFKVILGVPVPEGILF